MNPALLSPYLCRVSKLLPFTGFGRIAERRWLKEPTQLQWRVTLPSAIYFILGIMIYNKVRKVPFQLSLIKKDTTKQRCCVLGGKIKQHLYLIISLLYCKTKHPLNLLNELIIIL